MCFQWFSWGFLPHRLLKLHTYNYLSNCASDSPPHYTIHTHIHTLHTIHFTQGHAAVSAGRELQRVPSGVTGEGQGHRLCGQPARCVSCKWCAVCCACTCECACNFRLLLRKGAARHYYSFRVFASRLNTQRIILLYLLRTLYLMLNTSHFLPSLPPEPGLHSPHTPQATCC